MRDGRWGCFEMRWIIGDVRLVAMIEMNKHWVSQYQYCEYNNTTNIAIPPFIHPSSSPLLLSPSTIHQLLKIPQSMSTTKITSSLPRVHHFRPADTIFLHIFDFSLFLLCLRCSTNFPQKLLIIFQLHDTFPDILQSSMFVFFWWTCVF